MKFKNFTLIICCIIVPLISFSQPTIVDQKTIGGNNWDDFADMCLTTDGGVILGGRSISPVSNEKTDPCRGGMDYWLVKLNSHHKIQWDKTMGGSYDDYLTCVQQTTDGGYIVGGFSRSSISGEKNEDSRNRSYDYWVLKLDSTGNIKWQKTIGSYKDDYLNCLQQTKSGGYILGGYSGSRISGEKTDSSRGGVDYWIVKLDSTGNIVWDKTIGGNLTDELMALQQTADGGYILGGYSESGISGEKTGVTRGGFDYWIVKLNGLGNIQWDKTIGGNGDDNLTALQQTDDGGYILGGYSESKRSGEKTDTSRGFADYWVVKVDGSGNIQWDKTIGGNNADILWSLQQVSDNGYVLAGCSTSDKSGEKTEGRRGFWDYWVVKLNRKGKFEWDKSIRANNWDVAKRIREIRKDHYIVGGYSDSKIADDKSDSSRGRNDYWIVYLNYMQPPSQVENKSSATIEKINEEFLVYPNPAKNVVHLQTSNKTLVTISDAAGKILLTKTIDNNGTINVSNFSPGVYYLKNNTTGSIQKLVVAR